MDIQNRNQMRELGRLLLKVRNLSSSVKTLDGCLKASNWDLLVSAVRNVARYDTKTHQYKTLSLALKIGHGLQACAKYLCVEGLKGSDQEDEACAGVSCENYFVVKLNVRLFKLSQIPNLLAKLMLLSRIPSMYLRYTSSKITAKCSRRVPVLLTEDMQIMVQILIEHQIKLVLKVHFCCSSALC